mgnify:CR=1 FL=1
MLADRDHLASNDQALAKEILQHSQGTKTKLLLVCSRDVQREMETGLALGAHAVISRPRPESQLAELLYAKLHEAAPLADMQRDTIGVGQTQSGWQRIQRLFSAVSESMTMYLRGARVRISSDFDSETAARPHAA